MLSENLFDKSSNEACIASKLFIEFADKTSCTLSIRSVITDIPSTILDELFKLVSTACLNSSFNEFILSDTKFISEIKLVEFCFVILSNSAFKLVKFEDNSSIYSLIAS